MQLSHEIRPSINSEGQIIFVPKLSDKKLLVVDRDLYESPTDAENTVGTVGLEESEQ